MVLLCQFASRLQNGFKTASKNRVRLQNIEKQQQCGPGRKATNADPALQDGDKTKPRLELLANLRQNGSAKTTHLQENQWLGGSNLAANRLDFSELRLEPLSSSSAEVWQPNHP